MKLVNHTFISKSAKWLLFLFFSGICSVSMAQYGNNDSSFWSNVRYGGGLGLSFGNDAFLIGLSPSAIYQANDYLAFGVGLNYTYSKIGDDKLNAVGGSLIVLANPVAALQLSAEFEELYIDRSFGPFSESFWVPALYLGVGYGIGPVTVGIRYDVLYDDNKSLYSNPWLPFVRVYF
ncbi:MAG: alpha-ketoglutarate decarboxylase [Robiginitalea sp.]